jgi:acyl-CoA thioesterase FadM
VSKSFEHPVVVRWRDSDALAHVNHAVFLTYLVGKVRLRLPRPPLGA